MHAPDSPLPSQLCRPFLYVLPTPPSTLCTLEDDDVAQASDSSSRCSSGSRTRSPSGSPVFNPAAGSNSRRSSHGDGPALHLRDCVVGSDESERVVARGLDIDDRVQMQEFMDYATQDSDCVMAAQVVDMLIPRVEHGSKRRQRDLDNDRQMLERYALYWTSLTPHSLCVLLSTIILLERLKARHPGLSATGHLKDTTLRVVFSAYLIAMKLCTEVSYLNLAFLSRTPWSLEEMNAMERELLAHLSWNVYIPAEEILARGKAFWKQRETSEARYFRDDGAPDMQALMSGNLFL